MVRILCICLSFGAVNLVFGQDYSDKNSLNVNFLNLSEGDRTNISSFLNDILPIDFFMSSDSFNVNFIDVSLHSELEDTIFRNEIIKILKILTAPNNRWNVDEVQIFYLGEIQFVQHVRTKMIYVNINNHEDYRHKVLMGLNFSNKKAVSVIKLSEYVGAMGFGNLVYSKYNDGVFALITALPGDVTGQVKPQKRRKMNVRLISSGELH